MRRLLLITAKDLRQGLRDRSVLLMAFVVPFGLALIFSLIFGDQTGGEIDLTFLVADEDGGELARAYVDDVLGGAAQGTGIRVEEVGDPDAAAERVAAAEADAVVVVPEGFTEAVRTGRATRIEVVANVDRDLGRQVATAITERFAQDLGGAQVAVAAVMAASGPDAPDAEAIAHEVAETPVPVTVVEGRVADDQLDQTTYLAAGMAVFFLFFTVQYGVLGMLDERRNGTLARLYAAPLARRTVLLAKTLTSFVLGLVSMAVLVVGTELLLGAEWGHPVGVAVLVLAGVTSAVSIVLLVGSVARTAEQAGTWQSIIAIVLGMAGGVFFDVSRGSPLLDRLSLLTPHRWFMRGLGELAGDGSVLDVLPYAAGMLVFGAVMLLVTAVVGRLPGRRSL